MPAPRTAALPAADTASSASSTSSRSTTRRSRPIASARTTRRENPRSLLRDLREAVPHCAVLARRAPHQPADAAVRLGALRLVDDVLRTVARRAKRECLKPGAEDGLRAGGLQLL